MVLFMTGTLSATLSKQKKAPAKEEVKEVEVHQEVEQDEAPAKKVVGFASAARPKAIQAEPKAEKGTADGAVKTDKIKIIGCGDITKRILHEGKGTTPANGDIKKVVVIYVGEPFQSGDVEFETDQGIQGTDMKWFEQGFATMKKDEKAIFSIPPKCVYGDERLANIPPQATFMFAVDLSESKQDGPDASVDPKAKAAEEAEECMRLEQLKKEADLMKKAEAEERKKKEAAAAATKDMAKEDRSLEQKNY